MMWKYEISYLKNANKVYQFADVLQCVEFSLVRRREISEKP